MIAPAAVRAVLFDLFGTVVQFAPRVPVPAPMSWLREAAEREVPAVCFEELLPALMQVSDELVRQRPPEYLELPSRERFRRALVRMGIDDTHAPGIAERLSLVHMAYLASTTRLPAGCRTVLQTLAARYRLGLISNFDHGATARQVLAAHDIARFFEVIVVSDGFGRRKPHAAIFQAALDGLGLCADEAVYVGDSVADDIIGATNARLGVVWINPKGEALPADAPRPCAVVRGLDELPALFAQWRVMGDE